MRRENRLREACGPERDTRSDSAKAPHQASSLLIMSAVQDYVGGFRSEDDALLAARGRAGERGCRPIGQGGGTALCFLAATVGARAVVEVGTGVGVSGLWLLRGMAPGGVLTSIDV